MIPAGYMLKKVSQKPDGLLKIDGVLDIYSVSPCISPYFTDYITLWKNNGYWFFDSPDVIRAVAEKEHIDISGTQFFYYEVYEHQYNEDDKTWHDFLPEKSFITNVQLPEKKKIEGYDVVTFVAQSSPECSPLSCNGLADEIPVNQHCLLKSFEDARQCLEDGKFNNSERGPFRIFAVYSLPGIINTKGETKEVGVN